ncbi:MAG: carbohydrate kinase [Spirochaetes bacterium]|jgi:xylulokinase|nr:carbohydrate kinase [Spirochaetota bacterium]
MRDLAIGIDIGTTGVKLVAADLFGSLVFSDTISHDLLSPYAGYAEEDPHVWWESVQTLLRRVGAHVNTGRIAALACSGMVPTLIPVDSAGQAVRHSIQQNDARATREIQAWKRRIDEDAYFERTGNTINQQLIFPKLEWLRAHEPANIARAVMMMGSYDYISYRLTGVPVVEENWALESGLWMLEQHEWDREVCDMLALPEGFLPPVRKSGEFLGETTGELEDATGFPAGIPVVTGIADHVASAFASGVIEGGDMLLKLGGAGDILVATERLETDRRLFVDYHPIEGKYLVNGCMAASGSIVRWLLELLQDADVDRLGEEASRIPAGSDGLITLPYFLGEKTPIFDVDARGVFFGLTLSHGRAHLFRSVLEAVGYGFMHHVDVLHEMGIVPERAFLSNGGARSEVWKSIVLSIVGLPGYYVPEHPGSCIGAAFVAFEGVGASQNWSPLRRFLERAERIEYSPQDHERYRRFYRVYRELYETTKSLFPELKDQNTEETPNG